MTKAKTKAEALPKSVKRLTDTQHASAVHAYLVNNGDIDKAHAALKKKIGKRTLVFYAERYRWDLRHEEQQNSLIADAVEDAKAKKKLDLVLLRDVKSKLIGQITNEQTPLFCKTLDAAAHALIEVIREEREIIGDGGGSRDTQTIFMFVRERVLEISDNGDDKSDNGDGTEKSRFNTATGELVDDNPFDLQR